MRSHSIPDYIQDSHSDTHTTHARTKTKKKTLHGLLLLVHHHGRQQPRLDTPDELVGLLRKAEGEDSVRENAGEVGEESLVDGEEALGAHRLLEAVENAAVEVPVLVVEAGHEGVLRLVSTGAPWQEQE